MFYQNLGNPDFFQFAKSINVQFEFIIEAGCHDGMDTLRNLVEFKPRFYHAFEPDSVAFKKSQENLSRYPDSVVLHRKALGDKNRSMVLEFHKQPGTGSSQISDAKVTKNGEKVKVCKLDDVLGNIGFWGLLWLDVEGFAVPALIGAKRTLRKVAVAKIEVQMHDMERNRPTDAYQVIQIMLEANLIPIYLPIHPGFFGDIYFLNREFCSRKFRIRSVIASKLFVILHTKIYPWLKKPKLQEFKSENNV